MNLTKLCNAVILVCCSIMFIGVIGAVAFTPEDSPKPRPEGRLDQIEHHHMAGRWVWGPKGQIATYYIAREGGPVLSIRSGDSVNNNTPSEFAVSIGDKGPVMQVISRDGKTIKHIDLLKLAELLEKAESGK